MTLALWCGMGFSAALLAGEPAPNGPPAELLEQNLKQAELVLEVAVLDVSRVANYPSDGGTGGYGVFLVHTRPVRCFKGASLLPSEFDYRFTQEAGAGSSPLPSSGAHLLVFLKRDARSGQWWVLAEASQFPMTPDLERELAARPSEAATRGKP